MPSIRHVRVAMRYSNPADPSNEEGFFDVVIDDQDRVIGKWSIYGRWDVDEGNSKLTIYPVLLKPNGEMYFAPDDSYSSNFRERLMRVGELCTVWSDDCRGADGGEAWVYKIRSVSVLGETAS